MTLATTGVTVRVRARAHGLKTACSLAPRLMRLSPDGAQGDAIVLIARRHQERTLRYGNARFTRMTGRRRQVDSRVQMGRRSHGGCVLPVEAAPRRREKRVIAAIPDTIGSGDVLPNQRGLRSTQRRKAFRDSCSIGRRGSMEAFQMESLGDSRDGRTTGARGIRSNRRGSKTGGRRFVRQGKRRAIRSESRTAKFGERVSSPVNTMSSRSHRISDPAIVEHQVRSGARTLDR